MNYFLKYSFFTENLRIFCCFYEICLKNNNKCCGKIVLKTKKNHCVVFTVNPLLTLVCYMKVCCLLIRKTNSTLHTVYQNLKISSICDARLVYNASWMAYCDVPVYCIDAQTYVDFTRGQYESGSDIHLSLSHSWNHSKNILVMLFHFRAVCKKGTEFHDWLREKMVFLSCDWKVSVLWKNKRKEKFAQKKENRNWCWLKSLQSIINEFAIYRWALIPFLSNSYRLLLVRIHSSV